MKSILKNLTSNRRQQNLQFPVPARYLENNLNSLEQFRQRLLIEKRRAERLNSVTSLIVLDVGKYLTAGKEQNAPAKRGITELAKFVCVNIRETDVVSLYQENLIVILLPDTDTMAARCVHERLTQLLDQSRPAHSSAEHFTPNGSEMEILSYPERTLPERFVGDAIARRTNDFRRSAWNEAPALRVAGINDAIKGARVGGLQMASGSALAVPIFDVCWWDPQVVSDLIGSAEKVLKRWLDVIGAIAGLILFSPLLLLTAILVKTTSRGPILFKQKRVGYRGESFTFLKFRTMYHNCENRIHQEYVKSLIQGKNGAINNGSASQPVYKIKNDPRITPVGRFLRKTSLDELPQFWNVLIGEMSLVGPRPPIPYEVEEYQKWHRRRVLEVKPGITGLWQVSGRNKTTFDEMVRLDIQYARHWSIALDIKILLKTIKVMLVPDGV